MRNYLHVMVTHAGAARAATFDALPRECPCCHEHASPWRLTARSIVPDDSILDFVFQCSRPGCRRVFVATYHRSQVGEYELDSAGAESWRESLLTYPG